ncbi:MAG: HAD family hydrolase, partial [Desulfocapsaceae bacterium]|nr:HAD family hydrolase [Desulfocapsaceae bacterium]
SALDAGVERFREIYELRWHEKTRPYPGVMEMLDSLQNTPTSIAVLSNKPDTFTRQCVHYFFPSIHFHAAAGNITGVPLKPDPQSTIDMLRTLETQPNQCLFVGDSSVDIKTGRAAGTRTLGVTWGFRTETELIEAGADAVISTPEELLHYVIAS